MIGLPLGPASDGEPFDDFETSFIQVTSKILDIPGNGFVTGFNCFVTNPEIPAWFGVLRPRDESYTSFRVICSEVSLGEPTIPFFRDHVFQLYMFF